MFNLQFDQDGLYALFLEHHPSEFEVEGGTEMGAFLKDAEAHDVEPAWVAAAATSDERRLGETPAGLTGGLGGDAVRRAAHHQHDVLGGHQAVHDDACQWDASLHRVRARAVRARIRSRSPATRASARPLVAMIMCGPSPRGRLCLGNAPRRRRNVRPRHRRRPEAADPAKLVGGCCDTDVEAPGPIRRAKSPSRATRRYRFLLALIVGDFFHNFTDGIFIGAAFVQRLARLEDRRRDGRARDPAGARRFCVLRTAGNLDAKALAYNVVSGSSVMLGGIAIMAADISLDTGMLLAYGAGNYIYCATVRMLSQGKTIDVEIKKLLVFIIGAVAIGLILLDHEHCVAAGATRRRPPDTPTETKRRRASTPRRPSDEGNHASVQNDDPSHARPVSLLVMVKLKVCNMHIIPYE